MANQEELQRITDSTLREMAAVIESHNNNYQDPEETALYEEIEKMKKEMIMVDKTIVVREKSNEQLKIKLHHVQRKYNKIVKPRDQKLKSLKTTKVNSIKTMEKVEIFHRDAMEKWRKKKAKFDIIIEKMNEYIAIVHSKLERYGINHDDYMTVSDEDESDESDNFDLTGQGQYESDTQFEDDETDGEYEAENQFEYQPSPYYHRRTENKLVNFEEPEEDEQDFMESSHEQSRSDENENEEVSSNTRTENMILEADDLAETHHSNIIHTNPREQIIYDDTIEVRDGQIQQETSTTYTEAETSVLEADEQQANHCSIVAGNSHETNWCDMIHAEDLKTSQQSQSVIYCKIEDEMSQDASSTEAENLVFESNEPDKPHQCNIVTANIHEQDFNDHPESGSSSKTDGEHIQEDASISKNKAENLLLESDQTFEVPQRIKLDPTIHRKVKREVKKPKKKQPKYKTLMVFGA